ncbi:acetyl-CoA carboxylase biotin carboxylase subunit [Alkalicoccus chagannorensis]|uniref:acetyl-CoA carboxylase biotin carboxylase subunit n=1 Tax=Alkalicoccus chagannorensis TaxID=427072 RepID=UPI0003F86C3C|nr:biotin carboxylase N-terminal domain-containing protein [Alkalicoccus chagannorensis]
MHTLLIANRGEIACRIIRTCRELGITSVAVYSDADEQSQHVKLADRACHIGGSRVHESYLNIEHILQAAKDSGAQAVHPGYGLLSENAAFAERVEAEGLLFIGPQPDVIAQMGDKIQARNVMKEAGVPVVPGRELASIEEADLNEAAAAVSFPLMLKAAAGGGGIGMQRVDNETELLKAAASVAKKAETFFASSLLYLEKYVEEPRHIEAQIFGDDRGSMSCIGLRDCSVQRRHQKVIEEAPPPGLSKQTEEALQTAAVRAASHLQYKNAGTVEFLVDKEENIYFLEMNTRLQVEHPVTEETTGADLVAWQLAVAEGKRLDELQYTQPAHAYALEVRLYAEDPKTFFPSPGTITEWEIPDFPFLRCDVGFTNGDTITPFYDPMAGKLIVHAESREQGISRMIQVLERTSISGIKTNVPLLLDILQDSAFQQGKVTTHFLTDKKEEEAAWKK